jgi:hypothetical protein
MCGLSTLKKAFDNVVRKALLYKLLKKGIGGKFFALIRTDGMTDGRTDGRTNGER